MDLAFSSKDVERAANSFANQWGHGDIWRMLNAYAAMLRTIEAEEAHPSEPTEAPF